MMGRMLAAFGIGLFASAALSLAFVPALALSTLASVAAGMAHRSAK